MKIIKQDRSNLRLQVTRNINLLVTLGLAVWGATAFVVIVSLVFLDNLGGRSIRCDRNPNNEVNCTLKNSHFLGIYSKSVILQQVKQAILNTTTNTNDDGDVSYTYGLSLQHKSGIQEVDSGLGFFGSKASKENFAQIDAFLKSKQPSIELNRSTFFDFDGYIVTFGIGAISCFFVYFGIGFILSTSKSNVLINWDFGRSLELLSKESFTLFSLFQKKGKKTLYVLSNIKGVEIRNSQNMDDDSSPQYSLYLTFHEPVDALSSMRIDDEPHSPYDLMKLEDGQKIGRSLSEFLQITPELEPINVAGLNHIYDGEASKFSIFGTIEDLSMGKFFKEIQDRANEFLIINFEPLGMMNIEVLTAVRIAGFADGGGIYGVILFKPTAQKAEILSTEFYSTFTSGASLTTTTTPNVGDTSHRKIFRSSLPNASLNELLNLHSDRLSKLNLEQGQTQTIETSLLGLAKAMDEYLVREGKI